MSGIADTVVDLRQPQFGADAFARAQTSIEAMGLTITRGPTADRLCAWIDQELGGSWSSLALAGSSIDVRCGEEIAGFATFDPDGPVGAWVHETMREPATGVAGPAGVARAYRETGLESLLVTAALASLRERGYVRAIVPAVERFASPAGSARRFRTVVLASGNGSNFQSVIDRVQDGTLPLELAALISNKADAYAIARARSANIAHTTLVWDRRAQSREKYDENLITAIEREAPDLVLLLGWMHLLPPQFFYAVPHAINIHPAFLPLDQTRDEVTFPDGSQTPVFRGAHAVRDALALGCEWIGASAHRVTLHADRGPVLARKPLRVSGDGELMERLHLLEHDALFSGIRRWICEQEQHKLQS